MPVDPKELREATVLAIRTLRLHEDRVALKKTQETLARARKTLAVFLDSGLTARAEREHSPEREAFVEAAIKCGGELGITLVRDEDGDYEILGAIITRWLGGRLEALQSAYRAMLAAEARK